VCVGCLSSKALGPSTSSTTISYGTMTIRSVMCKRSSLSLCHKEVQIILPAKGCYGFWLSNWHLLRSSSYSSIYVAMKGDDRAWSQVSGVLQAL